MADKKAVEDFAALNECECAFVQSNLCTIIDDIVMDHNFAHRCGDGWWHGFQHSMVFLGSAVVMGYRYGCEKIYIASSRTLGEYYSCASDPRTDNEFKCANIICIHDGYELGRQDKVAFLVRKQKRYKLLMPLRVCSFKAKNCCNCEKCLRTMLAIVAEGGNLSDFGFNLSQPLYEIVSNYFERGLPGFTSTTLNYWEIISDRMKENLQIYKENEELYHLLAEFPYGKAMRIARIKYIEKNFFGIIWRRIRGVIRKISTH